MRFALPAACAGHDDRPDAAALLASLPALVILLGARIFR
jgi:hypothetical protein